MKNLNATIKHKLFGIFLGSLFLGVLSTNWYLQEYQPFLDRAYLFLQREFRKQLGVHLQARVTKINFLQLSITLENVVTISVDKSPWTLKAGKLKINCSLLSWLYSKKIGLSLTFNQAQIHTKIQKNTIIFFEYLKTLFATIGTASPFVVQSVQFSSSVFEAVHANGSLRIITNGQLGYAKNRYTLRMYVLDGIIKNNEKIILNKITGTTNSSFYLSSPLRTSHMVDLQVIMPGLPKGQQTCTVSGSWADNAGALVMHNSSYTFHIDPLKVVLHNGQYCCQGLIKFPLSLAVYLTGFDIKNIPLSGNCMLQLQADNVCCSGDIKGTAIDCHNFVSDTITVPFITDYNQIHGTFEIVKNNKKVAGIWESNFRKNIAECTVTNSTDWVFDQKGYWAIPAGEAKATVLFKDGLLNGDYSSSIKHIKTETRIVSSGSFSYAVGKNVTAVGTINNNSYALVLQVEPIFKPLSVLYKTADGVPLVAIAMKGEGSTQLEGSISYDYIKTIAQELFDYELSAAGSIEVTGEYQGKKVQGTFKSSNGLIRIPEVYNFITDCSGKFAYSFVDNQVLIHDVFINLHKGKIRIPKVEIVFSSSSQLEAGMLDLQFDSCFLHWKNDFFTLVSGSCFIKKQKEQPSQFKSEIVFEKGQLKENPFSQAGSQQFTHLFVPGTFFDNDVVMDVTIKTKEPLFIKTPQLRSKLEIDVTIGGSLKKLETTGSVTLLGGELKFPYQSLYITRAQLHCLKDQPYDPLIDLTAQGMIKKYMISLGVSGSLQHPHITLSSVPLLTEEQIVSLLFTGSSYESLTVMIPALVMQSIEGYLFGTVKKTKIDHWLDPLKRIRIIPSFADQAGRGGFKGVVEVDVSDYLHAKLQKNFSLSEDTALEIEYLVSDEISIKGTRDERSDMGAEIEMRFKF